MIRAAKFEIIQLSKTPWLILPLLIICIPIFYLLGEHCIYMWDEAIYANNAIEMLHDGNWFVIQNNGIPSHYNVKPQLVTWMQALSMSVFGVNEWALRLPSALAAFGTALLLLIFSRRWTGTHIAGVLGAIVLVSAFGFVRVHLVRTADLDAVLLFFTTAYSLLFIDYLLGQSHHKRYLRPLAILVFLAFLSKSLAGLLPLFPLFILAILTKRGRTFLLSRDTWMAVFVTVFFIVLYYFFREKVQPGYFEMVWNSEFKRLTHNVMPWHKQPFHFYLLNFVKLDFFFPHIFILPLSMITLFLSKSKQVKKIALYTSGFVLIYLLFVSVPVVKLEWYDAPIYPMAGFIIGLSIWHFAKHWSTWFVIILLTLIFPYRSVLQFYTERIYPTEPLEREGHFMRTLYHQYEALKAYRVYMEVQTPEHLDQMRFYQKKLNWFEAAEIDHLDQFENLNSGDTVLCCQPASLQKIDKQFYLEEIIENRDCKLFVITKK